MAGEDELKAWLDARGLSACAQILADNAVDLEILPDITDQDLVALGLVLGLRRKLLKAAATLRAPDPAAAGPSAPRKKQPDTKPASTGERRYVTILFSDLVGSTKISAELDAEEWRDLVAAYHAVVAAAVEPLGGNVAQKMGDGAMVYFGYPRAQENDPERAVRAGLAIFAGLTDLNRRLVAQGKPALAARVGMHSGPVVVDGGEFAFGDVPNIAARVQSAAEPGQVLISEAVHRHVAGLFIVEDRGRHNLKGVPEPVTLLVVVRASGGSRRSGVGRAATPFVGREEERRMLRSRWNRVRGGEGRVATIVSDAGLGKSRLLETFRAGLAESIHTWVEWPSAQLLQQTPFHPIAEWGRQRFGGSDVPVARRFADLEATVTALGLVPQEVLPLLAPLFDLVLPDSYAPPALSPEESRRRQMAAIVAWVVAGARTQPLVLVLEDAQWADPSTLELFAALVEVGSTASLFIVITARPEFHAPWPLGAHHEQFALGPLGKSEALAMVGAVTADVPLSPATTETVVERSGGVPLFIEEVARLLVESGGDAGAHDIPPTLHASLLARLDRLGAAKEVAQIGSVAGREFDWPLIRAITTVPDMMLSTALDQLGTADMIHVQGEPPEAIYRFNHALFQDAAYDSLLKSRRRELHEAVARALKDGAGKLELLAYHLTEAGDMASAIPAWQRAGEAAMARGAFIEASAHFDRGIGLLRSLPGAAAHAAQEFKLRSALAQCYWAHKGFGAPETRAAFESALAVGQSVGDTRTLATVLSGLVAALTQQAQFDEARVFADRLSTLAQWPGSGNFERGWAALRQAAINFYTGRLDQAREQLRFVQSLSEQGAATAIGGVSLSGMASIYSPWLAALTDDWDLALDHARDVLKRSGEIGSAHDRAFALTGAVIAGLHLQDAADTGERLRQLLDLTEEHRLRVLHSSAVVFEAWAMMQRGDAQGAAARFATGIRDYEAIGQRVLLNWFTALQAEAIAATGDFDQALATMARAESLNAMSPLYGPEVLRIRAVILLRKAATMNGAARQALETEADSVLDAALAEARRVGFRLIETQVRLAG
ncbi:MAG TPA: AAA family ATPase [Magnetospirillaceae bacterium]|jgi:class 3 adenylate cyclase/tetratricopeptide (TPR) repeat protein